VASTRVLIAAGRLVAEGLSRATPRAPRSQDRSPTTRRDERLVEMIDVYLGDHPRDTEVAMSYESTAEPIKLGYLFDFRLPESTRRRCGRT
jgi:hypothetical protein